MKSLAELNALKEKMKSKVAMRKEDGDGIKIVVGMATCGIAAGARPVLMTLTEEVNKRGIDGVTVAQAGCIGICQYEPVVEVFEPGKEKVTYIKMDSEKAKQVIDSHIIGGKILPEYTIGSVSTSAGV
jgi:NADP-reducing hydrogenase subunit HndB